MTDEQLVDALKALGHPVRLRIMQALCAAERNVGEIDDAAGIGQPTLSQQLAVLRKAGLVTTRKEAKLVYYRIDDSKVEAVAAVVSTLAGTSTTSARRPPQPAPGVANFARMG